MGKRLEEFWSFSTSSPWVYQRVFSLSSTLVGQPATVLDGGSGVLDNFCPIPQQQTSDLAGFRRRSFSQNQYWKPVVQDSRRQRFFIFWWFDEGTVNFRIISIFVIADAVTVDKPTNWCHTHREQDRSQNGLLWDTGAGLDYRHQCWPTWTKNDLPERYNVIQLGGLSVTKL